MNSDTPVIGIRVGCVDVVDHGGLLLPASPTEIPLVRFNTNFHLDDTVNMEALSTDVVVSPTFFFALEGPPMLCSSLS